MADAIAIMVGEHRLIESIMSALDGYVAAMNRGDAFERADLGKFVRFFREYADARHHDEEEKILFRAMREHGAPESGGPVQTLMKEHVIGRAAIAKLAAIADTASDWPADALATISETAGQFNTMLRQHIDKEDSYLYPMAREILPRSAFQAISDACAEIVRTHDETESGKELRAMALSLIARYG